MPRQRHGNMVGERVRDARSRRGLSQSELAAKLQLEGVQIGQSGVSELENGIRPVYDSDLVLLSRILRVTPNYLLGWTE
jgi:transcriptional regulator with XRE-family HTH domain